MTKKIRKKLCKRFQLILNNSKSTPILFRRKEKIKMAVNLGC